MTDDLGNPDILDSRERVIEFPRRRKRNRAPKPERPSSVYSVKEAAEILGVSTKTIYRRFRENGAISNSSKLVRKRRRQHITIPKHLIDKYVGA